MSDTVFSTLCDIVDDLQRLAMGMAYSPHQLALERLVDRLDACIDATVDLEGTLPPDQADTLTRCGDPCPVCGKDDCTHWHFLNAEEHR